MPISVGKPGTKYVRMEVDIWYQATSTARASRAGSRTATCGQAAWFAVWSNSWD